MEGSLQSLKGKVVLIAGGGRGVGRVCALHFASRGAHVVITGRNERALGETIGEIVNGGGKARHLAGDLLDSAHRAAVIDKALTAFGSLDIVIVAAGKGVRARELFEAAAPRMSAGARLIALVDWSADADALGPELAPIGGEVLATNAAEITEEALARAWEEAARTALSLAARA